LESDHEPIHLNYLDIPLVYEQGNSWNAHVVPLSMNVPYIVKSFLISFDVLKRRKVLLSDAKSEVLVPFFFQFQDDSNNYFINLKIQFNEVK
jgi:hypothetical protein